MSGRISPFEALTGSERQLKWLEYQSIRLPYVHGNVDTSYADAEEAFEAKAEIAKPICTTKPHDIAASGQHAVKGVDENQQESKEEPKAQAPKTPIYTQVDFQRSRHTQYDAVLARMKQAEKKVSGFHTI